MLLVVVALGVPGCAAFRGADASQQPTNTPAASVTPAPTGSPEPSLWIDHPLGSTDVVLRLEWGGGLVPAQTVVTQMPQFTLYGDGTVVFRSRPGTGSNYTDPLPPLKTARLSDDAIQVLLAFALDDGGLADARTSYEYPGIADATTTTFSIDADGVDKTIAVYALIEGLSNGPDRADRDKLLALQNRLSDFENEAQDGATDGVTDFDPTRYRVALFEEVTGTPPTGSGVIEWPWRDIQPTDFTRSGDYPWRVMTMSRSDVSKLTDVPNGGQMSIWLKAPDGSTVALAVRPLLPDEVAD